MLDHLRERLRIAVICSGDPDDPRNVINRTHNPRGWKSYRSGAEDIREALVRNGFNFVKVLEEGRRLPEQLASLNIHMAWLNTGGLQGYDGMCHAAAMLESLGICYVGHRPAQTALMDNKYYFKLFLRGLGLPTAPFIGWDGRQTKEDPARSSLFRSAFGQYGGPFIIKPVSGRASNNVLVVDNAGSLRKEVLALNELTDNSVLVEMYLPGAEFCVAAVGTASGEPHCFSHLQRVLGADEKVFTSMDVTPISAERVRLLDVEADAALLVELNRLAMAVYRALGLTAMVRADLRQAANGAMNILEFNPKPDLRNNAKDRTSLIALGLARSNMSYDSLILDQLLASINHTLTLRGKSSRSLSELLTGRGVAATV